MFNVRFSRYFTWPQPLKFCHQQSQEEEDLRVMLKKGSDKTQVGLLVRSRRNFGSLDAVCQDLCSLLACQKYEVLIPFSPGPELGLSAGAGQPLQRPRQGGQAACRPQHGQLSSWGLFFKGILFPVRSW